MPTSFTDVSLEIQEAIININITGTLRVTKIILPGMIKRYLPSYIHMKKPIEIFRVLTDGEV